MFNPAGVRGRDSEAALKFNLTDLLLERGREKREERRKSKRKKKKEKHEKLAQKQSRRGGKHHVFSL